MDTKRVYFPAPRNMSKEEVNKSPQPMKLEKQGMPYNLYSTSGWSTSMGTVWGPPLIPEYNIGQEIQFGGQEATIIGIEPVQYNGTWDLEYEIQFESGETLKIMQPNLP